ncbi:MAG: FxsA family protein [Gammaproteobacteria bacterium]|nr:FxsA family protein [Gammaproteobacteria bacterium]
MSDRFFPRALLVKLLCIALLCARVGGPHLHLSPAGGELPARPLLEATLMLIAGGLLVLPGFLSDILGLCLLLPALRRSGRAFQRSAAGEQSGSRSGDSGRIPPRRTRGLTQALCRWQSSGRPHGPDPEYGQLEPHDRECR